MGLDTCDVLRQLVTTLLQLLLLLADKTQGFVQSEFHVEAEAHLHEYARGVRSVNGKATVVFQSVIVTNIKFSIGDCE